jgi:hypothetical protein
LFCVVGEALTTLFGIYCVDWIDEGTNEDRDTIRDKMSYNPLMYEYSMKVVNASPTTQNKIIKIKKNLHVIIIVRIQMTHSWYNGTIIGHILMFNYFIHCILILLQINERSVMSCHN